MEFEIGEIVYDSEDIMQIVSEQEFIDSKQHSYTVGSSEVFVKILKPLEPLRDVGDYFTNDDSVNEMCSVPKLISILYGE